MGLSVNDVTGIGAVATLATDLVDRIFPDKVAQAKEREEYLIQAQTLDNQLETGQAAINQVEASSNNMFVAGWRPFVGWVCGIAFAYHLIVTPIVQWYFNLHGITYALPQFDDSLLSTTLEGMLGLGVLRTIEKMSDKAQLLPWQNR